jgi:hypothetical protein
MIPKIKNIVLISFAAILQVQTFAQELAPTLPTLAIAPDARSSSMGDASTATSADANSQHWNAAKYVFSNDFGGAAVSYTPWLRAATHDIYITYLSGFYKYNKNESVSASLRFFSLGNIDFYTNTYDFIQSARPNEFALDFAYSRRLGKYASGAITFRYINSTKVSILNSSPTIDHISNVAGDIAFYYQKPVDFSFAPKSELAFGATVSNLGTKVNISDSINYFLPMNMKLGARLTFNLDDINFVSPTVEIFKSLVPTDSKYGKSTVMLAAVHGLTSDFSRITWVIGAEYSYKNQMFFRTGYHYEPKKLSSNSYLTFGLGLKYRNWDLSASYLFVTDNRNTLLDNTYRISLSFTFANTNNL